MMEEKLPLYVVRIFAIGPLLPQMVSIELVSVYPTFSLSEINVSRILEPSAFTPSITDAIN